MIIYFPFYNKVIIQICVNLNIFGCIRFEAILHAVFMIVYIFILELYYSPVELQICLTLAYLDQVHVYLDRQP